MYPAFLQEVVHIVVVQGVWPNGDLNPRAKIAHKLIQQLWVARVETL